jgi:hypothetical protein
MGFAWFKEVRRPRISTRPDGCVSAVATDSFISDLGCHYDPRLLFDPLQPYIGFLPCLLFFKAVTFLQLSDEALTPSFRDPIPAHFDDFPFPVNPERVRSIPLDC